MSAAPTTGLLKVLIIPGDTRHRARVSEIPDNLNGLKAAVGGGWVELIGPTEGRERWCAYCDEEGKIKAMPVNERATNLARTMGWTTGDVLCGPVVFLGPGDSEGNDTDVPLAVQAVATVLGYLP